MSKPKFGASSALAEAALRARTWSGTFALGVRPLRTYPDPALCAVCPEVEPDDPAVLAVAESLVATMRATGCPSLAATQIGEAARVFCVDVTGQAGARSNSGLVILVNPQITRRSRGCVAREGCVSIPDFEGDVDRPEAVTVVGYAPLTGRLVRVDADALEARCVQHAIDHLNGLLFFHRAAGEGHLHPRRRR